MMKKLLLMGMLAGLVGCAGVTTPLPKGFQAPESPFKCAGTIIVSRASTLRSFDAISDEGFELGGGGIGSKGATLISKEGLGQAQGSTASALFIVPSLDKGVYEGNYQNAVVNKEKYSALSVTYLGVLYTSFGDPTRSRSTIEIEGHEKGYIWGNFSGFLYSQAGSDISASGKFACKEEA